MAENSDKLTELRAAFKETHGDKTDVYDERDLEKLEKDDLFATAFLKFLKEDIKKTINMLDVSFKWRKQIGLNDLKDSSFEKEMLETGNMYYRNKDKNGTDLFLFKFIDIKRSDIMKKYIAFLFEKHFCQAPDQKVVLVFDMSGVGAFSLEMDLFKYLLACATDYFPHTEYLLIYEMAWVLNAAWKVIRALMSEETRKYVHIVKKSEMINYVEPDQLPEYMGGTDTYTYEYVAPTAEESS